MPRKPKAPAPKKDVWTLGTARSRLSEVVRKARRGAPQHVTLRGQPAVLIADPERLDISAKSERRAMRPASKAKEERTMAGFIGESKKYRGSVESLGVERGGHKQIGVVPLFDNDEN
jgi:prevent-host-death family protein